MTFIGNRIPHHYFLTHGSGESDITVHAGSYHLALRQAGIEAANIITYSSIMPGTAVELRTKPVIVHGEVMETIMAVAHAKRGDNATAGLIFGWLYTPGGLRYGGLVCEYNGEMHPANVNEHLRDMLMELYHNGYDHFELKDVTVFTETIRPEKKFGTALVAICFTSYEVYERTMKDA